MCVMTILSTTFLTQIFFFFKLSCSWWGSNLGSLDVESDALPVEPPRSPSGVQSGCLWVPVEQISWRALYTCRKQQLCCIPRWQILATNPLSSPSPNPSNKRKTKFMKNRVRATLKHTTEFLWYIAFYHATVVRCYLIRSGHHSALTSWAIMLHNWGA